MTRVTARPSWRSDAATSDPIHPPPTTTTDSADAARSLIRSASPSVRRVTTPSRSAPGTSSRRGAGRKEQTVEPDCPGRRDDLAPSDVDALDLGLGHELDALL